ncbi:MAG: DNA-processing protein DprA [Hyphomicrobium sp.]
MPRDELSDLFTPAPLPVAPLDEAERVACLRLIRSANVGPVTFRELINHYGGAAAALDALPDLAARGGLRAPRICPRPRAMAELDAARRAGAVPLFTIEPGYPKALAAIDVPPPMIYARGNLSVLQRPSVAIVGSRLASAAGMKLARLFAAELGRAGLVVVSGLARGIDAAAHEASLETGTVGVVAGGIDVVYPPEHADLHRRVGETGCIVTEMPPGFQPRGKDFPRRNRIIAGLSLGTLVIESARKSGTLVTARHAGEQGREVFAVPGHPLDPRGEGNNRLLKSGATLVTEPADVLEALQPMAGLTPLGSFREVSPAVPPAPLSAGPPVIDEDVRTAVLGALGPQPADLDELARATGLGVREVRIAVMELDLAGRIEHHGRQLVSLRDAPPSSAAGDSRE